MRTTAMAQPLHRPIMSTVLSRCRHCNGELAVLSVINGRAGLEYWALQCIACHGVDLDIIEPPTRH